MSDSISYHRLMSRLQTGSEEAVRDLVSRYGDLVLRSVRRHFNARLQGRFDSIDFVQEVWTAVLENRNRLAECMNEDALVGYLATVAKYRVIDEIRRNVDTEKQVVARDSTLARDRLPDARLNTPSQHAVAEERREALRSRLPSAYQKIVQLRMEGNTLSEIATAIGVSERTVRRVLKRLARQLDC